LVATTKNVVATTKKCGCYNKKKMVALTKKIVATAKTFGCQAKSLVSTTKKFG